MAKKQEKRKIDKKKLFVRVVSGILAGLTILAACTTFLYYILN